jgi:hypothetical protein
VLVRGSAMHAVDAADNIYVSADVDNALYKPKKQ